MSEPYLFTSLRMGFRCWREADLDELNRMNGDPEVMRYFPSVQTPDQNLAFLQRMQQQYQHRGYCYFAAELLETQCFIGFAGLSYQDYPAPFTPCVDIGWRLLREAWGKGYATEAARRCRDFAFEMAGLDRIISVAPVVNTPSIHVMEKLGMKHRGIFRHPRLKDHPALEACVWYEQIR